MNFDLTQAELEAVRYAARGFTVVETASAIYKSPETIKTQLVRARLKLGARNTPHLVAICVERGIVTLPDGEHGIAA